MSSAAVSPIRRGQLGRAAPGREDAELRLRQTDRRFRRIGHHPVIARERQLAAAAEACAVDRGDGRLRQFREAVERLLAEADVLLALFGRCDLREFRDIGAGDEDRLARGDDDALDVGGAFELVDDAGEFLHHVRTRIC